jgi:hypothetical protein
LQNFVSVSGLCAHICVFFAVRRSGFVNCFGFWNLVSGRKRASRFGCSSRRISGLRPHRRVFLGLILVQMAKFKTMKCKNAKISRLVFNSQHYGLLRLFFFSFLQTEI